MAISQDKLPRNTIRRTFLGHSWLSVSVMWEAPLFQTPGPWPTANHIVPYCTVAHSAKSRHFSGQWCYLFSGPSCCSSSLLASLSAPPFFTCISAWISHLAIFCPAIGPSSFIHQPIKATHIRSIQKGIPHRLRTPLLSSGSRDHMGSWGGL